MYIFKQAPGTKKGKQSGSRVRTQRHTRQKYGDYVYVKLPKVTNLNIALSIGTFAVFGLIIIGILYCIFG